MVRDRQAMRRGGRRTVWGRLIGHYTDMDMERTCLSCSEGSQMEIFVLKKKIGGKFLRKMSGVGVERVGRGNDDEGRVKQVEVGGVGNSLTPKDLHRAEVCMKEIGLDGHCLS